MRCLFAHVVAQKGGDLDGYVVEQLKKDILWLGHSQIIGKRYNEPALIRVVGSTVKALKQSAGVESASAGGSVPYSPQSNGRAESPVRIVKGMFRTLLFCLERQIHCIPLSHPVVAWPVTHAAQVRNMRIVGQNGKTGWQLARGNSNHPELVPFGELCRYKAKLRKEEFDQQTGDGVWVCVVRD